MTFDEARACVIDRVTSMRLFAPAEAIELECAAGRVLAEQVLADRDYPAMARSARDGFAVNSRDVPGTLRVVGEVRAGEVFEGEIVRGEAVEIMTGAPVPRGANAIVMVEHVTRDPGGTVTTDRAAEPGQFINAQGWDAG